MRRAITRLVTTAGLLAAGALVSIAVATGSRTANSTSFDDASGDNQNGPDVTRVRVTNRDDGMLVFEITVPNRESMSGNESIEVFMDTDRNGSTGTNGADFALSFFARSGRVYIDKWAGSSFAQATTVTR